MQSTPEQSDFIKAVCETEDNLQLDAVAGSGKTTTLLKAASAMTTVGSAIALAFNKKIKEELERKLPSSFTCKTLNGLGHGIWAEYQGRKKLDSRKMADITSNYIKERYDPMLDTSELWFGIRNLSQAIKNAGYVPQEYDAQVKYPTQYISEELARELAIQFDLPFSDEIYSGAYYVVLQSITEAFTTRIDFDDQLYMSTYFADDEAWPNYNTVMIDEAQDLSILQHDMLHRLGANARIIVVGDERQAIYGWRGASANSLKELTARFSLVRYPLTVSFRCPPKVIQEAQKIVPHIKANENNPEPGSVTNWNTEWKPTDIPEGAVVLCRNNAPLVSLAFKLLRDKRPAYFAGRDLSAGLKKIVDKLNLGVTLAEALVEWKDREVNKAKQKDQHDVVMRIEDYYQTLEIIMEGVEAKTQTELKKGIDYLFRKEYSPDAVELSTIHRAKGKEWIDVYFLNRHLIPGTWLVRNKEDLLEKKDGLESEGKPVPEELDARISALDDLLLQESNLEYVAITRSLKNLTYLTLERN